MSKESIKDELLLEAATILEQEGWLVCRQANDVSSHRWSNFAERYTEWQQKVRQAREADPDAMWQEPPDNS